MALGEIGKRWEAFPISSNSVIAIRAFVALLSVLSAVLTALVDGSLQSLDSQQLLHTTIEAGGNFLVATGFYALLRNAFKGRLGAGLSGVLNGPKE